MSSVRYFSSQELKNSPSRKDGIDEAKEAGYRKQMGHFGMKLRQELKLPEYTYFTAVVYCDRFFALRSHAKNDRYLVAASAIFLAAKATDSPRPVAHVAQAYFRVKNEKKPQELAALHKDPARKLAEHNIVESIMIGERALLYTMNFHVKVDIPLWTSGQFTKQLSTVGLNWGKEKETATYTEKQKNAVQLAINFANDSFKTTLPVQYPMEKLVVACIICAITEAKAEDELPVPVRTSLYEHFDITRQEVEDFRAQLMSLFVRKPAAPAQSGAGAPAAPAAAQPESTKVVSSATHVSKPPPQPDPQKQPPAADAASDACPPPAHSAGTNGGPITPQPQQPQPAHIASPNMVHAPSLEEGELVDAGGGGQAHRPRAGAVAAADAGAGSAPCQPEAAVIGGCGGSGAQGGPGGDRGHQEDLSHDVAAAACGSQGDAGAGGGEGEGGLPQVAAAHGAHDRQEQGPGQVMGGSAQGGGLRRWGAQEEMTANRKRVRDESQLPEADISGHAKTVRVA